MRRKAHSLALSAAIAILCVHQAWALSALKKLTLDAGGCTGVEWKRLVRMTTEFDDLLKPEAFACVWHGDVQQSSKAFKPACARFACVLLCIIMHDAHNCRAMCAVGGMT